MVTDQEAVNLQTTSGKLWDKHAANIRLSMGQKQNTHTVREKFELENLTTAGHLGCFWVIFPADEDSNQESH